MDNYIFANLYKDYYKEILAFTYLTSGRNSSATDAIFQKTMDTAFKKFDELKDPADGKRWLLEIVQRATEKYFFKNKKKLDTDSVLLQIDDVIGNQYTGLIEDGEIDYDSKIVFIPNKDSGKRSGIFALSVVVVVMTVMLTMLMTNGTMDSIATKVLDRFYTATGLYHMVSDKTYLIEMSDYNDEKKLDKAFDIMPNLYLPKTLPNGYSFKLMTMEKQYKNNAEAIIIYADKTGDELYMIQQIYTEEDTGIGMDVPDMEEKIHGGTLIASTEPEDDAKSVDITFYKPGVMISFSYIGELDPMYKYVKEEVAPSL